MDSKKPIRFEAGKKLNEAEKKEMYKSLKDSYRENNRPYTIEDDKLVWLDDSAPYMTKSDITERMLRWYIILPDGKIAHPTEVFGASVQLSDLERVQKNIESNEFWAKKYYDEVSAELEKKGETEKVVDAINKAKANGAELKGEYSSDDVGKRHKRVRLVFDNGNNVSVPEYVINIEGSYLGLTKEDWVKQKIGEGKNRFLHFNWAEIDWEKFHSENFNWLDVFRESTPEEEAAFKLKQETEAKNEKENWYQKSKWSKKYAPTYKDAVEKMKKEYLDGKKTFEDWGSRVYKSNKGVVFAGGDDIHGEAYTIGGINEHRKKNRMMGAKMQMDEAIANLKELGVPESEINELIEQKEMISNSTEEILQKKKANELREELLKNGFFVNQPNTSITNFGVSTYIGFYDEFDVYRKFRISDHSVTNTHRIWNEYHYNQNSDVSKIVEQVKKDIEETKQDVSIKTDLHNKDRERTKLANEKWERVKDKFKDFCFKTNSRTYQDLSKFSENKNRTNIYQKALDNNRYGETPYYYEWTEPKNQNEYCTERPSREYIENFITEELVEQKENKGIVEPVNEWAIEINQIYNQWLSVKNENDWKKWKENVKSKKYGTYKNKDILDILDNFEPKYPNEIIKKDWITELHKALDITLPLHLKGQMQKAIDNKIEVKENKEMTKEIKEGQVYLNTTNNKKVQIDKVEGNEAEFPSVYYHIFGEEKSYRNSNIDRLSLFEDLVEKGAFVLIDSELEKGKAVEMEHKETLEKVATGEITPEEGVLETAETHIAEDPKYYDKLEAIEMSPEKQAELKSFKQRVELLLRREYSKTTTDKLMEENNSMIEDDFSLLRTADRTFREIQEAHEKPQKEKYNSLISNSGINSERIDNWNQVPVVWKNTKPISKVNFVNTPYNKELIKLLDTFAGNDALRPVMSGIHFDGNGITATNAHKLITLPYPNPEYNGTYATIPKRDYNQDKDIKDDLFVSTKYPNYEAVTPKAENAIGIYEFSVYKALQYTRVALKFANKVTNQIAFSFGDTLIAFNGEFLSELLETALKLGHTKLFSFTTAPNRAIVLSPDRNYEIGKSEIFLLMPVLIVNDDINYKGGAMDLDWNREIKVYYDFSTDSIYNADGTKAEFKMNYGEYDVLKPNEIKALDKYAGNNSIIPVLDNFKVQDGKVFATNLDTTFTIKGSDLKDGLYKVLNGAIEYNATETLSSFDSYPILEIKVKVEMSFIINSDVLKFYLEKAIEFTGKDELRPVMMGVCFDYKDGKLFMAATDAHKMFKVDITEYVSEISDKKDFQFILSKSNLMKFLKVLEDTTIEIKANNANIEFDTEDYNFVSKAIDGKYPNYNSVISSYNSKKLTINVKDLFICLKSKEAQDFIKKHKREQINIIDKVGEKEGELDIYLFVWESNYQRADLKILEQVKICSVKYKLEEGNYQTWSDVLLLMPIMHGESNSKFAFNVDFFKDILDIVNCENIEIFFSEPNRAYIIDGDCFKYKHTIQAVKKSPIKASVVEEVRTEKEIVEQEEKDKEVIEEQFNEPDADLIDSRTTGAGTSDAEDAIVLLNDLLEDAKGKQKKTILEAINLLKDLL